MNRVLRFKHHLRIEPLDGERVFLVSEQDRFMLHGRVYAQIAPLLDGRHSEREVVAALRGQASLPEIYYALVTLEQRGYIAEEMASLPGEVTGFWQSLGADTRQVTERLAAAPVSVCALGGADSGPLVEALMGAGVVVGDEAENRVILTGDYLDPELSAWNREARRRGITWMPVKPSGPAPWFGPVFQPRGACWECLAQRLRANRPVESYLEQRRGDGSAIGAPRVALATSARAAMDLAAVALARWIGEGGGPVRDKLLVVDLARFVIAEHAVTKRPQCAACGDSELLRTRALLPVVLESRPRRFTEDGGYRAVSPEETCARHEHLISPITGVISSLGPVPGHEYPRGTAYRASFRVRPIENAPSFDDFHRASAGKGRTPAQARASALCEGLERYSAIFQGDEPRLRATLAELGGEGIPPRELDHFSDMQYASRVATNAAARDRRLAVPPPFDERKPIDWTPVWSLTHERRRYVPTTYCYINVPSPPDEQVCPFSSNGNAAGNCLEEAVLQGFLELAERDAIAVWWYNRLRRPRVDLKSFEDPVFVGFEEHYRAQGFPLWVLDLTHDLGIFSFVALARSADGRFCVGFGSHFDARIGISRALTELNQTFDPSLGAPMLWDAAAVRDPGYLYPDEAAPPRRRSDYPAQGGDDLSADIRLCVDRAARAGMETLVLDQTRPDIGLSVVKVIVPGMRHYWPRLGPGRLYDVPVRMGWLARPLTENEINPVHLLG
ncbi:TOMM precursor leader peptide-binding protein [Polyangium sp. 6x1]|uniref:TOMM precursor leader peptide-binding protein n=1 Tax=Polyangium sp. 6x1 TaxID=3042689 RepID=UPI0024821977|nr:TOMM precursor leader peptide-binding protein [Polyangium sp. 6x1]MDI1449277.1 TOMM precursor leader peptide-binding protein [Polyangium sp. 6x1]